MFCVKNAAKKTAQSARKQVKELMMKQRFTLFDLSGTPKGYYEADLNPVHVEETITELPKHHIIVVDRSGSMCYDMKDLKASLKKILALHEYIDENMLISLISYSSTGDATLHFKAIPVSQVDTAEIDRLRATFLTCVSQALEIADGIIQQDHLTGVTLHSDGYANDPSYYAEKRAIADLCCRIGGKNTFINTIAYRPDSDFQMLSWIANRASGRCVQANTIKDLYDSIMETFATLKCGSSAALEFEMNGADYVMCVCPQKKLVMGNPSKIKVRSVDPDAEYTTISMAEITKSEYDRSLASENQNGLAIYSYMRCMLAEGNINMAKYLLASTGNKTLFDKHWRACTSAQLAAFTADIEELLWDPQWILSHDILPDPVCIDDSVTVLDVLQRLDRDRDKFMVNVFQLEKNYKRRSIRRLKGVRKEDGSIEEPWLDLAYTGEPGMAVLGSLDISTTTASVAMNLTRSCQLVKRGSNEAVTRVAGVGVDQLTSYNNYTIVSDGVLNVSQIPVVINDCTLFTWLANLGILKTANGQNDARVFDFRSTYVIDLSSLPITKLSVNVGGVAETFRKMAIAKIIASVADATTGEVSDRFTTEQVEELKKHYLSKNMYINFPTTNEYADLDAAIKSGMVDVITEFKMKWGCDQILGLDSFRSANQFLTRYYKPDRKVNGKITCALLTDPNLGWELKQLSARSKETPADVFQKQVFDFLLLQTLLDTAGVLQVAQEAGASKLYELYSNPENHNFDQELEEALVEAARVMTRYAEQLYVQNVFPVSLFIGATGMVPDDWNVKGMSAEDLQKEWKDCSISKKDQDGMFFLKDDVVFGVSANSKYVSSR